MISCAAIVIGELQGFKQSEEAKKLLASLNYDRLDDHPSVWVRNVQSSLIESFKAFPDSDFADLILDLYQKGVSMEVKPENSRVIIASIVSIVVGLITGWLFWA